MNVLDADEPEVLHAVFSFLDEWEAESKATSETTSSQAAQPTAPPIKRPRSRRGQDLQKQELLRLREEVPVLERRLKSLQSARARHEAANCDASRVIALAARELRAGRPDPANGNLLLVWKEMAKRYQRLRKEAGNENRALRNHIAHQLRTIESLQKLVGVFIFHVACFTSGTPANVVLATEIHLASDKYFLGTCISPFEQNFKPCGSEHIGIPQHFAYKPGLRD
ncbi:unnamed protein product [Phytophthora lilii]|uniref:Unnamed protein product n=1 Tax=Phytophthora lilii TaxID=2077276 RepID=A0A9W6TAP8_9STRA|nr:unnamed protein product [Phytophthora lilii]